MSMSNKTQYDTMPQNLLDNLSEMSYGGYVLFSFDGSAKPQVHSQIDDDLNAMSLQYFIKNWSEAMEEISRESFLKNIANRIEGNDEEDYEDE
jgi:hypothetical protein|tara:strand:- start:40 stop:318 length:279 start_codon:yes stop_codon:yes gene_type:complete